MYLNGVFEDDASIDPAAYDPANSGGWDWLPSVQIPSASGDGINWTGAINTALQTWTLKNQADTNLEIAKLQAQQRVLPYSNIPGYYGSPPRYSQPGLSPFPATAGSVGGINYTTWIIIAALIAGGYVLLKD